MATPRPSAARSAPPTVAVARLIALVVLIATLTACGGTTVPTAVPSAQASADAPLPSPTPWPSDVIDDVLTLGLADAELWKAGADIAKAADAKDVEAMLGAAEGTVTLLNELMPSIASLEAYPHTAELGAAYRASFQLMLAGATQLGDAIKAGDATGVVAGSKQLAAGVSLYGDVRAVLQPFVDEAAAMKGGLVQ